MQTTYNLEDVRRVARRKLPKAIFDFVDGGAEDEKTLHANTRAFEQITFRPRLLVDVSTRDQSTAVCGTRVTLPVLLGPAGLARLVHRDGERAAARAAGRAGTVFVLSSGASCSIEEVAAVAEGPLWFQVYLWRDHEVVQPLVERAQVAGYEALCLTIDVPVVGKRERDLRNGMTIPPRINPRNALDASRRIRWLRDFLLGPPITLSNLVAYTPGGDGVVELADYQNAQLMNPGATWRELVWLRELWSGPLLVKGITTAEDARRAIECGVEGIIVSNHGGRQLDGLPAAVSALAEVVEAVGGEAEVLLDGGVRRGTDVAKALALGASACLVARPYLFALAAGGEEGVIHMIDLLRTELDRTLALLGRPNLADLDRSVVCVPEASVIDAAG